MSRTARERLFVLGLTSLVYGRVARNPFWADDYTWLARSAAALRDLTLPFTAVFGRDYNPLAYLGFAINYALFDRLAVAWHAVDIAIHLGCVGLVDVLARRLTGDGLVAFLASLAFGIHVAVSEPVLWSAARVHSLMLLFLLGAAIADVSPPLRGRALASPLLFAIALNVKETAIGYALLAPVLAVIARARRVPSPIRLRPAIPAIALIYGALRWLFSPTEHLVHSVGGTTASVMVKKLALTIAAFTGSDMVMPDRMAIALLPIGAVLVLGFVPRDPRFAYGALFAVVLAAPYLPAPRQSSRYCYAAWPGLAILFALVAARLLRRGLPVRWATIGGLLLLGAWSIAAIQVEIDDYARLGAACDRLLDAFEPLSRQLEARVARDGPYPVVFLDAASSPLATVVPALEGRPKLVAYRRRGVSGLITFEDMMNIHFGAHRAAFFEVTDGPAAASGIPATMIGYRGLDAIEVIEEPVSPEIAARLEKPGETVTVGRVVRWRELAAPR
ncbi:MAG: hypothetical protein U0166_16875 [Acidobacteriota bacterium]